MKNIVEKELMGALKNKDLEELKIFYNLYITSDQRLDEIEKSWGLAPTSFYLESMWDEEYNKSYYFWKECVNLLERLTSLETSVIKVMIDSDDFKYIMERL